MLGKERGDNLQIIGRLLSPYLGNDRYTMLLEISLKLLDEVFTQLVPRALWPTLWVRYLAGLKRAPYWHLISIIICGNWQLALPTFALTGFTV